MLNDYVIDQTMFDLGEIISYAMVMRRELIKAMNDTTDLADSVCEIMDDFLPAIMSTAMHANNEHQEMARSIIDHKCEGNL